MKCAMGLHELPGQPYRNQLQVCLQCLEGEEARNRLNAKATGSQERQRWQCANGHIFIPDGKGACPECGFTNWRKYPPDQPKYVYGDPEQSHAEKPFFDRIEETLRDVLREFFPKPEPEVNFWKRWATQQRQNQQNRAAKEFAESVKAQQYGPVKFDPAAPTMRARLAQAASYVSKHPASDPEVRVYLILEALESPTPDTWHRATHPTMATNFPNFWRDMIRAMKDGA